jgi:V/A-type H+-transporting ATPase subunit E
MAELDNVSRKILDDAAAEKQKILDEAIAKAADITAEAEKKAEEIMQEGKIKAHERYQEVFGVEVTRAKTELNQKVINYKIDLIDDVIAEAKKGLSDLDKKEYEKFLKKTLNELKVKGGSYQIGSREKNIDGKMIESIAKLKKEGGSPDFKKGVRIIKGRARYDITADSLIDPNIEDIRMETALNLFVEEK